MQKVELLLLPQQLLGAFPFKFTLFSNVQHLIWMWVNTSGDGDEMRLYRRKGKKPGEEKLSKVSLMDFERVRAIGAGVSGWNPSFPFLPQCLQMESAKGHEIWLGWWEEGRKYS
jgi:hypothetical protein